MPHPAHRRDWVYILTNQRNGTLYVGVTGDLHARVWQHKTKAIEGFTKLYGLTHLVHFVEYRDIGQAIAREKEIKRLAPTTEARADRSDQPALA
ncbi:MAG TPA: GIY-YIG nuclease family protein [Lacunisphaera sp.]|nr:GIY-YIG nuclease family protein [Lacunisphaera sp.]